MICKVHSKRFGYKFMCKQVAEDNHQDKEAASQISRTQDLV